MDEAGQAVDPRTIDLTLQIIVATTPAWTGGRLGVDVVERGTGSRLGEHGWVTITWDHDTSDPSCGDTGDGSFADRASGGPGAGGRGA